MNIGEGGGDRRGEGCGGLGEGMRGRLEEVREWKIEGVEIERVS